MKVNKVLMFTSIFVLLLILSITPSAKPVEKNPFVDTAYAATCCGEGDECEGCEDCCDECDEDTCCTDNEENCTGCCTVGETTGKCSCENCVKCKESADSAEVSGEETTTCACCACCKCECGEEETEPETPPAETPPEELAPQEQEEETPSDTTPLSTEDQNKQALSDTGATPDIQEAAAKAIADAGTTDYKLSEGEAQALVNNLQDIKDAEEQEKSNGGKVEDTSVPAASNLVETVSELKDLSATPKVTAPKALEPAKQEQVVASLGSTEGINAEDIKEASPENITIGTVPESLEEQTSIIKNLLESIADALTKITTDGATNGVTVATTLPSLAPKENGYYPMAVNLRHIVPGRKLKFWSSTTAIKDAAAGTASISLSASDKCYFLDESGNVTDVVKGDASKMTVVPYLEGRQTYGSAFITVDATKEDQDALKAYAAANPEPETSSSSGGGCDLGFSALGLAAVSALMLWKKK